VSGKRSVAGIAVAEGLVFVARRVEGGSMGGKWEFPGGKVEPGETDQAALVREFLEEFSVPVRVGSLLATSTFEHHGHAVALSAYEVFLPELEFTLSEHTEWKWVRLQDVPFLDFADSDLKLLPALRTCGVEFR